MAISLFHSVSNLHLKRNHMKSKADQFPRQTRFYDSKCKSNLSPITYLLDILTSNLRVDLEGLTYRHARFRP